ncbi:MAG: mechanosensitive ion channel family protein [Polyangiaceae bacterium]|nr:mechanosensitive ion channel family protein [Polyangiaceae bacterium]
MFLKKHLWAIVSAVSVALVCWGFPLCAWAQPKPAATASADAGAAEVETAPDSPRASVGQFVELCRAGAYQEAARYLDLPSPNTDGAAVARKLKSVLDRHVWSESDLALLASPYSSGNVSDKLPAGVDELGTIPGPKGNEPVRLVRRAQASGTIWVFSRSTVERVDIWYARLSERWLFDALPEPLLRPGPADILYWQYLAMPLLIAIAWTIGRLFSFLTRKVIAKAVARTASKWDDELIEKIGPPLTLAWGLGVFALLVGRLGLYEPARDSVSKVIRAGFLVALFWSGLRAIDVSKSYLLEAASPGRASARGLVPLGSQVVKLLLFAAAAVTTLSELGYPVASLLAGLGIGGVALALAAQKTVENLFGSVSIGVDQPFRIGDLVRVEDVLGVVETIGLRSTRIRTLDRTLVTIPNGKLADMRIESLAARDRFRLHAILGLEYGTSAAMLRNIVNDIEVALREEKTLFAESMMVVVKGFGPSSIDVEVMAWFETGDVDKFVKLRQELLLRLMEVVEQNGAAFAFPTQTVHIKSEAKALSAAV